MALHELEHCPDCRSRLYRRKAVSPRRARGPNGVAWRRQVIELPSLPAAEVTEHVMVKRWCGKCEHWQSPQLDWRGMVVGQGRLGIRLVSVIAYLRTTLRLPLRQTEEYLGTMHGVRVSVGELTEVLHRVRKEGQGLLQGLKEEMRRSALLHMDETGWRDNGQDGHVWVCSTGGAEPVRYHEYDRSRSQAVAQRLLGARAAAKARKREWAWPASSKLGMPVA